MELRYDAFWPCIGSGALAGTHRMWWERSTVSDSETPVATSSDAANTGDGQTVSLVVSGLSGHVGDDLAGVLYEEDHLVDLDIDPVGGFWSVVATEDFTTTEVLRDLGP